MLFVSELGAAVGRNRYQTPQETLAKIWKRIAPDSFRAMQRESRVRTEGEVLRSLAIAEDLAAAVGLQEEASASAKAAEIMTKPLVKATVENTQRVRALLQKKDVGKLVKVLYTRDISIVAQKKQEAAVAELIKKPEVTEADVIKLIEQPRIADCEEATRVVKGAVNKRRGTRNEDKGIAGYEQTTGVAVKGKNDKFYKANLGTEDNPCWIGGRVDGLTADKVVEVKSRRNRFFNFLPEYERCQITIYMHLTDRPACDLVQRFNGDVRVDTYEFDQEYWDRLVEDILDFNDDLLNLLEDEDEQRELLAWLEKRRKTV